MTSFKTLVTSKSFADLVYADYVQNRDPLRKPQVHLTIVRTPKLPDNTLNDRFLSAKLTFAIDSNDTSTVQSLPLKLDHVSQPLAAHIEQLKILDNLVHFVEKKLSINSIEFED